MTEHTSGPWRVGELRKDGYGIFAGDVGTPILKGKVKELPDARLIAEAPEMLTACVEIVACIRDCNSCNATGIQMGTTADACYDCGGVGEVLGGDDIFAAFTARDILKGLK